MADQRDGGIAWTDTSWNPVRGCSRVSAGCGGAAGVGGCYAERMAARFAGPGMAYEGLVRIGKNGPRWTGVVRLIPEHLDDPLRWRDMRPKIGRPRRIFVNSMSDLFHEGLRFEEIAAVFAIMEDAPQHIFQVITKRPKRARDFFKWLAMTTDRDDMGTESDTVQLALRNVAPTIFLNDGRGNEWPLPNVWIGVSVEDQATAGERIPVLLSLPAAVRFVSYEPALDPVDFAHIAPPGFPLDVYDALRGVYRGGIDVPRLDWIIVGGESGPGARPFDLAWMRSTIAQCTAASVPVFCKQLGAFPISSNTADWVGHPGHTEPTGRGLEERWRIVLRDRAGADPSEWPADLRVREFPR